MDKLLLLDSSEKGSEFITRCLTKNGYDVIHLTDAGGIALWMRSSSVDLVIIDSEVGNESGYDICQKLKRLEESKYVPTLIMGGSESKSAFLRAMESGADDFIVKEFDESVLLSKVKSLLRIKKLSTQLTTQYAELEEKNKLLDMQLNMARRVQRSLINEHDLTFNGVSLMSRYMPALEIGGDFYDVISLDDEQIAVVIGDVSGHGISAALLTAMLSMMIKNFAHTYHNPAQFLYYMNNEFAKVFESVSSPMYACMFYAVINTKKRRIYYSNAGQALPVFFSAESGQVFELDVTGMPVGMMRDVTYELKTVLYGAGDAILFYTDGLADNLYKDNANEFYARITSLLLETAGDPSLPSVLNSLIGTFCPSGASGGKKYEMDDVSVVLCKMT